MTKAILFFALTFGMLNFTYADGNLAPPSFSIQGQQAKAVYVDFKSAVYNIIFDISKKETKARSLIVFNSREPGFPVFDLTDVPTRLVLDGKDVTQSAIAPATDTRPVRVIHQEVGAGEHTLIVEHTFTGKYLAPEYSDTGVNSGFFMDDDSGDYLQNFLPSTYEFSQYKMFMKITFVGGSNDQAIFSNGVVREDDPTHWTVEFPPYFNCSAVFFHTVQKSGISALPFTVNDGTGNFIPAVAYKKGNARGLQGFKDVATKTIGDLTQRFGKFPHRVVVLYDVGGDGGMEYSGASVTSLWALPHELGHSYFGRGIMPANGNAGWIDEALATLTEGPYTPKPGDISPTNMSSHSPYYTQNDDNGYVQGMNLFAHFGEEFHSRNSNLSIEDFLKSWVRLRTHQTITTEILKNDLETYAQMSLTPEFDKYVYGRTFGALENLRKRSPYPKLTREMLQRIQ